MEGVLQEITQQMECGMKEMKDLTLETRKTLESSVTVLQGINLLLAQMKTLTENANRLYVQMIGADKAGVRKSRWTFIKGVLIGILVGMAAWLVIAVILK